MAHADNISPPIFSADNQPTTVSTGYVWVVQHSLNRSDYTTVTKLQILPLEIIGALEGSSVRYMTPGGGCPYKLAEKMIYHSYLNNIAPFS